MDASENQVFMAVYHSKEITNLYISDKAGLKYSLSFEDIVGPRDWEDDRPDFGIHLVSLFIHLCQYVCGCGSIIAGPAYC